MNRYFNTKPRPPPPPQRHSDEHHLYGEGLIANRSAEACTLRWLTNNGFMTKEARCEISAEEFERLRREPEAFREIALKHDPLNG